MPAVGAVHRINNGRPRPARWCQSLAARLQLRLFRLDASGRPFHDYGAVRTRSKGKERLKRERAAPPSEVSAWLAMRRDQGAFFSAAAIMAEDRMP